MKKLKPSLIVAASALAGAAPALAADACKSRVDFGAAYDAALEGVKSRIDVRAQGKLDAAVAALAAEAKKLCPTLPWSDIMATAQGITEGDVAIRLGTTPTYEFFVLSTQLKTAAQNAIDHCSGSGINLGFCLQSHTCAETGQNSCICQGNRPRGKISTCP